LPLDQLQARQARTPEGVFATQGASRQGQMQTPLPPPKVKVNNDRE
jgi:hypothetical protein